LLELAQVQSGKCKETTVYSRGKCKETTVYSLCLKIYMIMILYHIVSKVIIGQSLS